MKALKIESIEEGLDKIKSSYSINTQFHANCHKKYFKFVQPRIQFSSNFF